MTCEPAVEELKDAELVVGSGYGTGALCVKAACEHRTAFQQHLFRVIQQVI